MYAHIKKQLVKLFIIIFLMLFIFSFSYVSILEWIFDIGVPPFGVGIQSKLHHITNAEDAFKALEKGHKHNEMVINREIQKIERHY